MASLLANPRDYHRPMDNAAIKEMVASLSGATTPPTERQLHFPLSQSNLEVLLAAINEVDTSGQPAFIERDLHDPWTQATIDKLVAVVI